MSHLLEASIKKITASTLSGKSYADIKKYFYSAKNIVTAISRQLQKSRTQSGKNPPTFFEDLNIRKQSPAVLSDIDQLEQFSQVAEENLNAMVFKNKTPHALGTEYRV